MSLNDLFTPSRARIFVCVECGSKDLHQHAINLEDPDVIAGVHRGMWCEGHHGYTRTRQEGWE